MAFNGEYVPVSQSYGGSLFYYNDPIDKVSYPITPFSSGSALTSNGGYFKTELPLMSVGDSVTWSSGLIGGRVDKSGNFTIYGNASFEITRTGTYSSNSVMTLSDYTSYTFNTNYLGVLNQNTNKFIIRIAAAYDAYYPALSFDVRRNFPDTIFSVTSEPLFQKPSPPNTESTIFTPNALIGVNTPDAVSEVTSDLITSYEDCIIPVWSGIDSGAYTVYTPTVDQFSNFTDYLWSLNLDTYVTNLIQNPIEIIISSHFIPLEVSEMPSQGEIEMRFGAVVNTGVYMNMVGLDFATKDFGEIIIPKVYDSFLDANPNTQIELYLPFCGSFPLDADVVVGNKLKVEYVIQLSTGVCVARVYCAYNVDGNTVYSLLFTADGNCRMECPITMNQTLNNLIASTAKMAINTAVGYVKGGAVGAVSEIASGVAEITSNKNQTQMSGNVGSNVGWLACKTPFVKVVIPKVAITENYADTFGYQSNLSVDDLATLQGSGFGQIQVTRAQWTDNRLTSDEWEETKRILAKGVIF